MWTPTSISLVLSTAILWSALDALRKRLARDLSPEAIVFWLTLGQTPVLALWWRGAAAPGELDGFYLAIVVTSVALNVAANLALVTALQRSDLSLTIPLLSLTPAATTLLAVPMLGEVPTGREILGIGLVVAGAMVLSLSGTTGSADRGWRRMFSDPGVVPMLVVVVCWSATIPLDKIGVARAGAALHGVFLSGGVVVGTLAVLVGRGRLGGLRLSRSVLPILAIAVVVSAGALFTQLLAIERVLVGLVEAIKRAVGNLGALLVGHRVFGEELTAGRVLALLALVAGAVLILT